jgi:hypothetical protein
VPVSFNPIDVGELLKALIYLGAGLWFLARMQGRIDMLGKEIKTLQDDVHLQSNQMTEFAKVLVDLARQEERLNAIDRRVEDLRRGQGFIQNAIDGEYPRKKG